MEDGIDSIDNLTDLGLDKLTAKVLLKHIAAWKEKGLPTDFLPSTNKTSIGMTTIASPRTYSTEIGMDLDADFVPARWCGSRAATDCITLAAEAGNHLAQAYLSILYDRADTLLGKNREKPYHMGQKLSVG